MICYTLKCEHDHQFESWFQNAEAFETLAKNDMVACSLCGSTTVEKSIMAPKIRPARSAVKSTKTLLAEPASPAEKALKEFRKKVEENSENVGKDFAAEARAIHDGDAPERSIIGEANIDEARALVEDGINVAPLPWGNRKTN